MSQDKPTEQAMGQGSASEVPEQAAVIRCRDDLFAAFKVTTIEGLVEAIESALELDLDLWIDEQLDPDNLFTPVLTGRGICFPYPFPMSEMIEDLAQLERELIAEMERTAQAEEASEAEAEENQ
ncbi:hypothetical protein [uncultured Jatrophihabitans sp.]|uniref:hypothetical protein n=1 Tax=uncultured Jatrophihabitans sp. TaxID=1610747 RepID=UPI0035CB6B80